MKWLKTCLMEVLKMMIKMKCFLVTIMVRIVTIRDLVLFKRITLIISIFRYKIRSIKC